MQRTLQSLAFGLAMGVGLHGAWAQKAFVRDDLATGAVALEQRLKRDTALAAGVDARAITRNAEALLARNDARRALPLFNQAVIADGRLALAWRGMAKAAMAIEPRDYRERWEMQERALSAAYTAYQRATGRQEEAETLATLGEVFAWRQMWRPALTTYRLSLQLQQNASLQKTYEDLRAERGFRVTEHTTEADLSVPRACFTFSEPLARGRVDFAPYVAVTGSRADTAVTAEGAKLCVEGLRHGERYGIVLRQGLPSSIADEVLQKNAHYDIYVRDRSPSVRFSGKHYVLPRSGQQGLPVVTVNVDKVALQVMRVNDRNLVNTVRAPEFLAAMAETEAKELANSKGQQVWTGTLDVKSELNREVTTAFPVTEAIGGLKPGVYAMIGTPLTKGEQTGAQSTPAETGDDSGDVGTVASQWFIVSDLGLTTFTASDGLHVLVRSLADASPVRQVEVELISRSNEVLGTVRTDASGHARFDAGLARGKGGLAPGVVTAKLAGDYAFLDMGQTAFDFSDRGVKGRVAPDRLDAFVYAERGVYRSGETVHLTTLLRDAKGSAVSGLPLTVVIRRPDGVEYRRQLVDDQGGGGRALSVSLVGGAPTGAWRALVYADPKGQPVGETGFLVEDYVAERLDADAKPRKPQLVQGEPAEIDVEARYLYGAPGADLEVGGDITVRLAGESAIPGLKGYQVGLTDEKFDPLKGEIEEKVTTDSRGRGRVVATLPDAETTRPVEAVFGLTVSERGGRGITREVVLPVLPRGPVVGVKPLFQSGAIAAGETARFDVVKVGADGTGLSRNAKWTLSKIDRSYQWFFTDGRWNFEAIKSTRRIADGEVALTAAGPVRIETKVDWGSYRLDVQSQGSDGAETAVVFDVGFEIEAKAETPDVLEVSLDKPAYAAGETMQIRLSPRFQGKATLAVIGDRVSHLQTIDLPAGGVTVPLRIDPAWGASAYVVALAHRPMDSAAKRMPGRAVGLAWFGIDRDARALKIETGAPAMIRPRGTLELPIKVGNLRAGETAHLTVSAVDIGILNLTKYKLPDASEHFFGQRQLSAEFRDLYGFLIDGMQGSRGAFRSGGDAAAASSSGDRPTQEPLARYSGVVKVEADGSAKVAFDIPAFNGSVKVMAVAWSGSQVGQAESTVIIRDPVVAQATLPRFLSIGDQSRFFVEINNVDGADGEYTLAVNVSGPVVVAGEASRRSFRLAKGQKTEVAIPVTAAGLGTAGFALRLTGGGHDLAQELRVRVQPGSAAISNRTVRALPAGGTIALSQDLFNDVVPGSGSVSVAVSPHTALDVPGLLKALDRYPYGCTEQTISRAMPLLYVNRLAGMEQLALDETAEARVEAAIARTLARQGANGSFGLWGVGGDDLWLDALAVDFLTRARERGHRIAQAPFSLALDRLRNRVVNVGEIRSEEASAIAYGFYVLARNGRPVMGDLRYVADNKLAQFATPMAKAQIGAALAQLGDRTRARQAFDEAVKALAADRNERIHRADYGSKLRDGGALMALIAEAEGERPLLLRASAEVESVRQATPHTSTQEQMWLVLAAQALAKDSEAQRLTVAGRPHQGALFRTLREDALADTPLQIANTSDLPLRAVVTVAGTPSQPLPALDRGYRIERSIFTMAGKPASWSSLRQNERYVVHLKISEPKASAGRVLVVDPLPAGIEIENPRLGDGISTEGLAFTKAELAPVHIEARDDRFVAAFDRMPDQKAEFTVSYIVRAVTPGRYQHAGASVEDMYLVERFGRGASGVAEVQPAR